MVLPRRVSESLPLCVVAAFLLPFGGEAQTPQKPDALKQADTAFHQGYAALQAGNLEQARMEFLRAARLAPQIPEGHEALGEVLIELNRPAEAVPEFEAALNLKPGDEGAEANLAQAYAKSGDAAKAIPQFAAAYAASQQPGGRKGRWPTGSVDNPWRAVPAIRPET